MICFLSVALRKSIPRQIDKKSRVLKEEKGVWNSQGGEKDKLFVRLHSFSPPPVKLLSCARLFAIPWTVAYQAPPSMEFSRQGTEWVAFPFFGDLATQGSNPGLLHFRQTLYCLSHHLLFSCPVSGNTLDAEPIRQKWPTMRVNVMTASPPKPSPPSLAAPAAQARTCSPSCAGRAASARASGRRSPR